MSEKLSCPVMKIDDCIGDEVSKAVASMPSGSICLLENTRFYKEEEKNEASFAKKLAGSATIFVNDAFGTAHRAHASTEGVTKYCKTNVAGFLLQKELDYLDGAVSNPERPFCAIVGGSKVSSKIGVIESLLQKTDKIILGGGMIFTFYKALGKSVGASLVEDDKIDLAKELMAKAEAKGVKLLLPTDVVVADKFAADANTQVVSVDNIPEGWMGLDVGPDSVKSFQAELNECKSSGTARWASSRWMPSPRVPSPSRTPSPTSTVSPSSVVVTPSPRSKRLASRTRCPTSPPVAVLPSNCSRARCSRASPRSTRCVPVVVSDSNSSPTRTRLEFELVSFARLTRDDSFTTGVNIRSFDVIHSRRR